MSIEITKNMGKHMAIAAGGVAAFLGASCLLGSFHGHFVTPLEQFALAIGVLGILAGGSVMAYGAKKTKQAWEDHLRDDGKKEQVKKTRFNNWIKQLHNPCDVEEGSITSNDPSKVMANWGKFD